MINKHRLELVKKLKYMAAFQKECLDQGKWEEYDQTESQIQDLMNRIARED